MNLHHGRAAARPKEPVMPVIFSGRAWTARLTRNNCLRQHGHHVASTFRSKQMLRLKETCARLLGVMEGRGRILFEIHPTELAVVAAVVRLTAYADQWLRQPEDWQPDPTEDARSQWKHLLRHLLARYPVPQFLDAAWEIKGTVEHFERDCWCALASGRGLREVAGFPPSVSKRVLHLALASGKGGSVAVAIWQAQLQCLGASPDLQAAVMDSRVPDELGRHELWMRLVAKFVSAGDASVANFALVTNALDAVEAHQGVGMVEQLMRLPLPVLERHATKFVAAVLQANGHLLSEEQVRQAAQKARLSRIAASRWQPMLGSEFFESRNGRAHAGGHASWRVEELCSVDALKAEVKAMNHCVAGYVRRCRQGTSAIFSLRHQKTNVEGQTCLESVATIEVMPSTREIVQIRAQSNRLVNSCHMRLVNEWAEACLWPRRG